LKTKLLIVSFDALGDRHLERFAALPNFGAFLKEAALAREVSSLFLTNTYPVHASVVTGLPQGEHGLISNTEAFPCPHPRWNYLASNIKRKTLWQAAAEKGLSVASVLWPVTGRAREIRWNIPEIMPQPGDNQVLLNLKNGSKVIQMECFLKYRHLMDGIRQPALDRFAAACMADILRRKKPDLALMHLVAFDWVCHKAGEDWSRLDEALAVMDDGFGKLLAEIGDASVIVFSDHAQLPVHTTVQPNDLLVEMGLLGKNAGVPFEAFIECCGGSAFLHCENPGTAASVMAAVEKSAGFKRRLTQEEMAACGRPGLAAGFCALPGYQYEAHASGEKSQHGYPLDYEGYKVFIAARGPGIPAGARLKGGSLLDIAPLALALLGKGLPADKAPAIPGLPPPRADFFG
jgi:hypothetical protein